MISPLLSFTLFSLSLSLSLSLTHTHTHTHIYVCVCVSKMVFAREILFVWYFPKWKLNIVQSFLIMQMT